MQMLLRLVNLEYHVIHDKTSLTSIFDNPESRYMDLFLSVCKYVGIQVSDPNYVMRNPYVHTSDHVTVK